MTGSVTETAARAVTSGARGSTDRPNPRRLGLAAASSGVGSVASRRVVDVVVVLAILVAATVPFPDPDYRPSSVFGFVVVLLPVLTVPLRRTRPGAALVVCVALYGAAALLHVIPLSAAIATAVATYSFAVSAATRRATVLVASGVMAVLLVLSVVVSLAGAFDPRTVQFVVGMAFAAAAGDATRSRRAYILAITERAERAEASRESEARRRVVEERLRIARDLHDVVAHQIAVISLNAGVASSSLEARPEKAREALGTIRGAARTVLREIGDLLAMLRTDDPDDVTAPQPGIGAELDRLVTEFASVGLDVSVRVEGRLEDVTGVIDLVAYRVVQEALTNAHKHGSGHRAAVGVAVSGRSLVLLIENPVAPSRSLARDRPELAGGHGLMGIRERVAAVRGAVLTEEVGGTWRLRAELPLQDEAGS